MKKVFLSILILMVVISSTVFAAINRAPKFSFERIKMKLGSTQAIRSLMNSDYDSLNSFESSNEDVVEILSNGYLKAKSTGYSVISYKYQNASGDQLTISCHVEVTRYDSTFDSVGGGVSKETIFITLDLGDYNVTISSTNAAIPELPKVEKDGAIFEGWYLEPTFETKVKDNLRFFKDTTIYPKWISTQEYEDSKKYTSSLYDDIAGHWAQTAIDSVSYRGLFTGVAERTFGPEMAMTRAMAVAVMGRMEEVKAEDYKASFKDVKEDSYYAGYLAWAVENKIVTDIKDNSFRPNDEITREEIAVYLANYLRFKKYVVTDSLISLPYQDIDKLSDETKQDIEILFNAEIMQGTSGNTFAPLSSVTRAQMAQIFYNLYNFSMKYKA